MRFAIIFGFFLIATWMRTNPVPDWLTVIFVVAAVMDVVEWFERMTRC